MDREGHLILSNKAFEGTHISSNFNLSCHW